MSDRLCRTAHKQSPKSNLCGIAVDSQSRIYISTREAISVYTNLGDPVSSIANLRGIAAFTLDKQNSVYVLLDDKVVKRPAI